MALFRKLTPDQLGRVAGLLRGRRFPPGITFIAEQQPGEAVYIIQEGQVRVHIDQEQGSQVILAILGPGEIVGEMSLVDSLGRSASVTTLVASTIFWMDRATFWECLRTTPSMAYNLADILSRRLRLANARIESLAALDISGRVARQILAFRDEYGIPGPDGVQIPFRLTQGDLADLVGASRVRVNQVLAGFKRRGSIVVDRDGRITIRDPEALSRRCR
jgi:CRP/FNR family cyclic AMP-dependent transcriptional regulator